MMHGRLADIALVLVLSIVGLVGAETRSYATGDSISVYVNKVGPYNNPTETYPYYSLPYCAPPPDQLVAKRENLGEVMSGDTLMSSLFQMKFRVDQTSRMCTAALDAAKIGKFRNAIMNEYFFEMYIDDLPLWSFVGRHIPATVFSRQVSRCFLLTHFDFKIGYNGDRVVEVNMSADASRQVELPEGKPGEQVQPISVDFTYSVSWKQSSIPYAQRMEKYLRYSFFGHELEIHWIGIVNSFIFVISLTTVLAYIMIRILRRDYQKLEEQDDEEDTGWKLLHGDVFRFPSHTSVLSAMLGVGAQLLCLALLLLLLAVMGMFYPSNRGALYVAAVVCYSLTAGIAGFISARWYKRMAGQRWARNILLTGGMVSLPVAAMFLVLNAIAASYGATSALPFGTIALIALIGLTVTLPLTLIGGILGKNSNATFDAPCRTRTVPGIIPPVPWYRRTGPQVIMAGFLPFSSIYIELYYIYSSLWGRHLYTLFGILLLVFLILLVVTACVTIMHTYFQLSAEDYRWWWASFFYGGSTGLFMYAYCFAFYFSRSSMSGILQTSFFFGWMLVACYFFVLMLGAVGFYSAMFFVRKIYAAVKPD